MQNKLTTQNIENNTGLPLGRVLDAKPCKGDCDRDQRKYDGDVWPRTASDIHSHDGIHRITSIDRSQPMLR